MKFFAIFLTLLLFSGVLARTRVLRRPARSPAASPEASPGNSVSTLTTNCHGGSNCPTNIGDNAGATINHYYGANWSKQGSLVLSSTAGAAEWQGNKLGEYQLEEGEELAGRPVYKQRDAEGKQGTFLYYSSAESIWYAGDILGLNTGNLRSPGDSQEPPSSGWQYWDGQSWREDDGSLRLEHGRGAPVCGRVEVSATGEAARLHPSRLGSYRPSGGWLQGRPVYRSEEGGSWLRVPEGYSDWGIADSVDSPESSIASGRGTLSPGQEEAGGNRRLGRTGWVYRDADGEWKDSKRAIRVTCTE